nr:MAG: DNA-binding protein, wHTH [uncultured archaeon]
MIEIPSMTPIQLTIFTELTYGKFLTRKDLVAILKTPRTTIYDNLLKLKNNKLVGKFSKQNGIRGRPVVYWFIPKEVLKQIRKNADKKSKN